MMIKKLMALTCLFVFFVVVLSELSFAQERSQIIEGAKKEGKVVWYGSLSIEDVKTLKEAFNKKYPFIEVEVFRASGEKVANKILTETRARRHLFDVVGTGAFEVWPLLKRGLLGEYVSPESKGYPAKYRDPKGRWNNLYNNYYVIGYSTAAVPADQVPKDWPDLLDPKWKSQIAIDVEDYEWYMAMLDYWGEEKGKAYFRKLAEQDILWRKGHTLITQTMVAGEYPLALIYAHRAEKMKPLGAPLDWASTSDPIISGMRVVSMSAKPQNPNAAKLLYDFAISKEGQKVIASMGRIPAHPDVDPFAPKLDPRKLTVHPAKPELTDQFEMRVKEFKEIFKLR